MVQGLMAQSGGCLRLASKRARGRQQSLATHRSRGSTTRSLSRCGPLVDAVVSPLTVMAVDDDATCPYGHCLHA
jgi:hypothetical protein